MSSYTPTEKKEYWLNVIFRDRVWLPGVEGVIVPSGQTFQRPVDACDGTIRYNTTSDQFEGFVDGVWLEFPTGSAAGEANTASNLGTGIGVFASKVGLDLQFKSLVAGTNISLLASSTEITIDAASAGEANTASNIGTGAGWFESKVGDDLRFKSLISSAPGTLTVTENASDITLGLMGAPYLELSGGVMDGDISFSSNARTLADSSNNATNPNYSFGSDTDTGMFNYAPDQIGFSAAGTTILFTRTNGVLVAATASYETLVSNDQDLINKKYADDLISGIPPHVLRAGDTMTGSLSMTGTSQFMGDSTGSAVTPSYAFDTMGGTGLFPVGGNSIGFTTTGVHRWTITGGASGGDIVPSSGSQHDIGDGTNTVKDIYSDRFLAGDGTTSAPSHTFINDTTVGIYQNSGTLGFSTSATSRWVITPAGNLVSATPNTYDIGNSGNRVRGMYTNTLSAILASALSPSIYFGTDTNTGLWSPAADTIGFATDGLDRMQVQPNGLIHAETTSYETLVIAGDDNSIPNKKYVNDQISLLTPTELDDLSDVTITSPVIDSYLKYNGAQWVDVARITKINDNDDDSFVNVDFSGSDSDTVRIQAGSNNNANAGTIKLETVAAVTAGYTGGDISVIAGDGIDAQGGGILIDAGEGTYSSTGGSGGPINIDAGDGYGPIGSSAYSGGDVNISGGVGFGLGNFGGSVNIVGGVGRGTGTTGGDVTIKGGNHDSNNVGSVVLTPGIPTGGGLSGSVNLKTKATATSSIELKFEEADGSDYVGLKAPTSISTSRTWTLPTDDPSVAAGDFVTTDASGNLSFAPQATSAYRQSFDNSDLSGSILTVTHSLGQKYVHVTVWSDLDRIMLPDITTAVDVNTVSLDLSSFVPLSGTWNIVVTA